MPRLRITFEVDERHVGSCLVLLEGRAKNLGFEVIEEVAFNKNTPKREKLTPDKLMALIPPEGATRKQLLEKTKPMGLHGAGVVACLTAAVKRKDLKLSKGVYTRG
jgi:hypothetical protein